MKLLLRVNEIFYSLSGEGVHAGIPTVFVRLQGCNLTCSYCDTRDALGSLGGKDMTSSQIKEQVYTLGQTSQWFLITGGEPLLQSDALFDVVFELGGKVRSIEVETNGSLDPPRWFRLVDSWNVDVKCPSSGAAFGSFRPIWLRKLRKQDQLKFVVSTEEDLDFVGGFLKSLKLKPVVLISPIVKVLSGQTPDTVEERKSRVWLQECADFCKEHNVRLSLQIQRIIYGDKRGV